MYSGKQQDRNASMNRTLSFNQQFLIYVKTMIRAVVDGSHGDKTDEFKMARTVVLRRIQGYRDSIVTSDVWFPEFKTALDKYPFWKDSDYLLSLTCEACRSNKPASFTIRLSHMDTNDFTPNNYDAVFNLGSECYKKGRTYHQLYHFESHILRSIQNEESKVRKKLMSDHGLLDFRSISQGEIYNEMMDSTFMDSIVNRLKRLVNDLVHHYNVKGQRVVDDIFVSSEEDEV
ncbi:hypothetical protein BDB01DRAFT_51702 [Pilobolus umbonatus]|nr:hypothetical protein BDB01DRAFT_51702 [Pilobolus umbonatus]